MDTPEFETGNLDEVPPRDSEWVVGFLQGNPALAPTGLRAVGETETARGPWIKWARHAAGDPRGLDRPLSVGRTFSVLVSPTGRFQVELSLAENFPATGTHRVELTRPGDFVIWGPGWHHRWAVLEDSTIMTVRWEPVDG